MIHRLRRVHMWPSCGSHIVYTVHLCDIQDSVIRPFRGWLEFSFQHVLYISSYIQLRCWAAVAHDSLSEKIEHDPQESSQWHYLRHARPLPTIKDNKYCHVRHYAAAVSRIDECGRILDAFKGLTIGSSSRRNDAEAEPQTERLKCL